MAQPLLLHAGTAYLWAYAPPAMPHTLLLHAGTVPRTCGLLPHRVRAYAAHPAAACRYRTAYLWAVAGGQQDLHVACPHRAVAQHIRGAHTHAPTRLVLRCSQQQHTDSTLRDLFGTWGQRGWGW